MRLLARGGDRTAAGLVADGRALLEADDPAAALKPLERARDAARRGRDATLEVEALALRASALVDLERWADAERSARAALDLDPGCEEAAAELGEVLYRRGRFEEARALAQAVPEDERSAWLWHRLGRLHLWCEEPAAARAAFRRAHDLEPDEYAVPVRVAAPEFDRIAGRALAAIPPTFARRLGTVLVTVQPLPDRDDVEDGADPDILGVYEGATALDEDADARIVLYQANHEAICGSLGELAEEVRRTIVHEVAHHFGVDDGELPF